MPYKQVEISGYVRDVLTVREGVDLDRLFKSSHSIEEFENLLVVYAPYLNISLTQFPHIERSRFGRIFPEERNFLEPNTYRVPRKFQWERRKINALCEMLEKFLKVLEKRLQKLLPESGAEQATINLKKTCHILLKKKPASLSRTMGIERFSPHSERAQIFSYDANEQSPPLDIEASIVGHSRREAFQALPATIVKQEALEVGSPLRPASGQDSLEINVEPAPSSINPMLLRNARPTLQFTPAPQLKPSKADDKVVPAGALPSHLPPYSSGLDVTIRSQGSPIPVRPFSSFQTLIPPNPNPASPSVFISPKVFAVEHGTVANLSHSLSEGSLKLSSKFQNYSMASERVQSSPARSILEPQFSLAGGIIVGGTVRTFASTPASLVSSVGPQILPIPSGPITEMTALKRTHSLQEIRIKALNDIRELEREIEENRHALSQLKIQKAQEMARLSGNPEQIQNAFSGFKQQGARVINEAVYVASIKDQEFRQFEAQKKKYKQFIRVLKNAYNAQMRLVNELETKCHSFQCQHQDEIYKRQALEQQLASVKQDMARMAESFAENKQIYLKVKTEKKAAEAALLKARDYIQQLSQEYNAKYREFEQQLQKAQTRKLDDSEVHKLKESVYEKEGQLRILESRLRELQVSHHKQLEQLQRQMHDAEMVHKSALQTVKQEMALLVSSQLAEKQRLEKHYRLVAQREREKLEAAYKEQVEALEQELQRESALLGNADTAKLALQFELKRLKLKFEQQVFESDATLRARLQKDLELLKHNYQAQLNLQRQAFEEQQRLLVETQDAKTTLEKQLEGLQAEFLLEKEKLLKLQATKKAQSLALERIQQEKQQLLQQHEIEKVDLQQNLNAERTKYLQQVASKEEALAKIKEALQQANALTAQLQKRLETTSNQALIEEKARSTAEVELMQRKLQQAQESHEFALANAKRECESLSASCAIEITRVREEHDARLKQELEKIEKDYKAQIQVLIQQCSEKERQITLALGVETSLQVQIQQLTTKFESEKARVTQELQQSFKKQLEALDTSYQERIATLKKLNAEQETALLEIREAQSELQRNFSQIRFQLEEAEELLSREKKAHEVTKQQKELAERELAEATKLTSDQKLALETGRLEKQQATEDFETRLQQYQQRADKEKATLRQTLSEEIMGLQREVQNRKRDFEQSEATRTNLEIQLREIHEQLRAKDETSKKEAGMAFVNGGAPGGMHSILQKEGEELEPGAELQKENQALKLEIIKLKQLLSASEANAKKLSELSEQSEQNFEQRLAVEQQGLTDFEEQYIELESNFDLVQAENQALKDELSALKKKLSVYETSELESRVLRTLPINSSGKENRGVSTNGAAMLHAYRNGISPSKGSISPLCKSNGNTGQLPSPISSPLF